MQRTIRIKALTDKLAELAVNEDTVKSKKPLAVFISTAHRAIDQIQLQWYELIEYNRQAQKNKRATSQRVQQLRVTDKLLRVLTIMNYVAHKIDKSTNTPFSLQGVQFDSTLDNEIIKRANEMLKLSKTAPNHNDLANKIEKIKNAAVLRRMRNQYYALLLSIGQGNARNLRARVNRMYTNTQSAHIPNKNKSTLLSNVQDLKLLLSNSPIKKNSTSCFGNCIKRAS